MSKFTPMIKEILTQYANGLLTKVELYNELETQQVRGEAAMGSFTGYDYINQEWIHVHFYDLK